MGIDISKEIEYLLLYARNKGLLNELDVIPARNSLLDLLKVDAPYCGELGGTVPGSPAKALENILDYCYEQRMIPDNTATWRDLLDARIMGLLMPRESEVAQNFARIAGERSITDATDWFYRLSVDSNYIHMDRIKKNLYWRTDTEYGSLEITINLSKPEKDPHAIAAAGGVKQSGYPKCVLCVENVGYAGRVDHPARQNHRVIPLTLDGEGWYFQYSPYVYYNEHCIVFYKEHVPMRISDRTFVRLFDFIEQFPHYFIGSNADLPIVGGSILSHEHFQGGRHVFPMERAEVQRSFRSGDYPDVNAGILKWPMSAIRLSSQNRRSVERLSSSILSCWRGYSDESVGIHAVTGEVPHNTITPIARRNCDGEFEMDLVLRNNSTSKEHPLGIFHPHEQLHHIKKENIGLIEVMGLAILPGRLSSELDGIKGILTGKRPYRRDCLNNEQDPLCKHAEWIREMVGRYGTGLTDIDAEKVLKDQVGNIFLRVLLDAGVFKKDRDGKEAFVRFMNRAGFR